MTTDELAAIRERAEEITIRPWAGRTLILDAMADITALLAEVDRLRAERDRLAGIVERLPKTADGVQISIGMKLFGIHNPLFDDTGGIEEVIYGGGWQANVKGGLSAWFSTRAAAEAARKEGTT